MPFCKRTVQPRRLCRLEEPPGPDGGPGSDPGPVLSDLCSVSNAALSRAVRQLSDLARHAGSLFEELERELATADRRTRDLRDKIRRVERCAGDLQPKLEPVPVSSLDVESKLREHFQSPWRPNRNVFLPSSRPPCVEELHRNAKQNLRARQQDQQQRQNICERDQQVTLSIAPPTPTHSTPQPLHTFVRTTSSSSSPTECCHFPRRSRQVDSDSDDVSLGERSKCPIPNIPSPLDTQTNWSIALPLPTPEDRMRNQSESIMSFVVPIDVTGAGFDRDASVRCSLVHSESVLQRRRKLRRRKTVPGFGRPVHQDSDESPVGQARTVMVHSRADTYQERTHLVTRDSGCQTDEFLVVVAAPSRRRIRTQREQTGAAPLSHSTGNIPSLPDSLDTMFTTSSDFHLRSRSLPRESSRPAVEVQDGSEDCDDDDDDDEELCPFDMCEENLLKDEEGSLDDQISPERQLGSLKFTNHPESPEHGWMDGRRNLLPRKADEISSSSDTFSSPVHSNTGLPSGQMDHRDEHQSSSGNWSGSSSTCPSQTSETILPAASPLLTRSSHCDSKLSLNTALNATEDPTGFASDAFCMERLHSHRTASCTSTTDMLEDSVVSAASDGEWRYPQHRHNTSCHQDFSLEHCRDGKGSLECPSFASIATIESLDRPPSDRMETMSHFSVDAEGYYTSMHFDCGLKGSKSFTYNYPSVSQQKDDYSGLGKVGSLSLRKPKVKPSPPKRSSSLKKISSYDEPAARINEPKISGEQILLMSSKVLDSQGESSDPSDQLESDKTFRVPAISLLPSTEAQSKSEEPVQSDYADLWQLNDLKSNDPYRSLSNSSTATGTTVIDCIKSQERSESQNSLSGSRDTSPLLPSVENDFRLPSPEKLVGLASPSSGYSSQSETPTSSMPSAFFPNPNPLSPCVGKRKPKVPERKSSLASLQQQISKTDFELPIIPPTHLDLSALHNVKKPSTRRNHILQTNKRKGASAKNEPATSSNVNVDREPISPLQITPLVLRSVQLRSFKEPSEGIQAPPCRDAATRPKCYTSSTLSNTLESKKPPVSTLSINDLAFQDDCDSVLTPADTPASDSPPSFSFTKNRFDRLAMTPLRSLTSSSSWQSTQDDLKIELSQNSLMVSTKQDTSILDNTFPQDGTEPQNDPTEGSTRIESPTVDHGPLMISEDLDQAPEVIHQLSVESSTVSDAKNQDEESEASNISTRSASQETMEDASTPDTEDYFSRGSTSSDSFLSPLTDETKPEEDVFLSPSKSRTTEDLFAMIHRSKRKVLGRRDSGDLSVRGSPGTVSPAATSPSTPVTPVTPTTPTSSHRVPGPIYRSIKKSNTSNEEFKQLLLKKGSRSENSYRMSATEILKSPVASRSFGDSLVEGSKHQEGYPSQPQLQSPEGTPEVLHSPFPKANMEGFSTKVFTSSSSRQSRSRLPPVATSSRYSTRSRLYTAPMQAISEGETENSDSSPHDDRSS